MPTTLVISGIYVVTNLALSFLATRAQKRFVGEKEMLQVGMIGEQDPSASER